MLRDEPDLGAQARQGQLADVRPVDANGTALDVVEAQHQIGQRTLAAAARSDQGDDLAAVDRQIDVDQDGLVVVAERDRVELDPLPDVRQHPRARPIHHVRLGIQHLEHPVGRREALLDDGVRLAECS